MGIDLIEKMDTKTVHKNTVFKSQAMTKFQISNFKFQISCC